MNIYDNYVTTIRKAIDSDKQSKNILKGISGAHKAQHYDARAFLKETIDMNPLPSFQNIISVANLHPNINQRLGAHPHFVHLQGSGQAENHYIVSVFIDIKGSTNLFREYNLETIMVITNTIQRAAIHTCVAFGGYVQRLQGDGLFVYFGGKGIDKKDATTKAVTACSLFTAFVKYDLKKVFDQEGIEDISTRIGIDFGDDHEVLWAKAGINECSEITTYSLHTSLASKMQGYAKTNGIVVGDNVKTRLEFDESLYSLVTDGNGNVTKRYIFEDRKNGYLYTQFEFNWLKYLRSLPYIGEDSTGMFVQSKEQLETKRLERLRQAAQLVTSGNAFTNASGNISSEASGIKNQPHRFHFIEEK